MPFRTCCFSPLLASLAAVLRVLRVLRSPRVPAVWRRLVAALLAALVLVASAEPLLAEAHGGDAPRADVPADAPAPIRVWVQPPPARLAFGRAAARASARGTTAWTDAAEAPPDNATWAVVRGAQVWDGVARGLTFVPTRDSVAAAVRVRWEGAGGVSGQPRDDRARGLHGHTAVVASRAGAITAADVTLGVGVARAAVSPADLRAVAAHEFGHVLGLAHRAGNRGAAASVMTTDVRADSVSPDDRAVLRVWYALPPGASCARAAAPPD